MYRRDDLLAALIANDDRQEREPRRAERIAQRVAVGRIDGSAPQDKTLSTKTLELGGRQASAEIFRILMQRRVEVY